MKIPQNTKVFQSEYCKKKKMNWEVREENGESQPKLRPASSQLSSEVTAVWDAGLAVLLQHHVIWYIPSCSGMNVPGSGLASTTSRAAQTSLGKPTCNGPKAVRNHIKMPTAKRIHCYPSLRIHGTGLKRVRVHRLTPPHPAPTAPPRPGTPGSALQLRELRRWLCQRRM